MATFMLSIILMCMPSLVSALHPSTDGGWEANKRPRGPLPSPLWRRDIPPEGYYNPLTNDGSMLTVRAVYNARSTPWAN
jgi:hypothetical protein